MAGFHLRNCSWVILFCDSIASHWSPETILWYLSQFLAMPGWVGE